MVKRILMFIPLLVACTGTTVSSRPGSGKEPAESDQARISMPTVDTGHEHEPDGSVELLLRHVPARPDLPHGGLWITLQNNSAEEVWINRRLNLHLKGGRTVDVWLEAKEVNVNKEFGGSCTGGLVPSRPDDYIVLRGFAAYSRMLSLACYQFWDGVWRVRAHYKDANSTPPPPPDTIRWVSEELVSNEVIIEGKPPIDSTNQPR